MTRSCSSLAHLYIGEDLAWPSPAMPGATRQKIRDACQDEMNAIFLQHIDDWVNLGAYETLGRNSLPCATSLGERFEFLTKLLGVIVNGEIMPNQGKRAIIKVLCSQPTLNKTDWKNDLYAGHRISRVIIMLYHLRSVTRDDSKFEVAAANCNGQELKKLSQLCESMKSSINQGDDDGADSSIAGDPGDLPAGEARGGNMRPRRPPQSLSPQSDAGKDADDEEDAPSEAPSRVLTPTQKTNLLIEMGFEPAEADQGDDDSMSVSKSASASAAASPPPTPKTPSKIADKSSAKGAGEKKGQNTNTNKTQHISPEKKAKDKTNPEKKAKADQKVIKHDFTYRKEFYKKNPIGFGFKRFQVGENKHGKHLFHLRSSILTRSKLESLAEKTLSSFKKISEDNLNKRERAEQEVRILASHKMAKLEAMTTADDVH